MLTISPHPHNHDPAALLTMLGGLVLGLQAAEFLRRRGSRYSY